VRTERVTVGSGGRLDDSARGLFLALALFVIGWQEIVFPSTG